MVRWVRRLTKAARSASRLVSSARRLRRAVARRPRYRRSRFGSRGSTSTVYRRGFTRHHPTLRRVARQLSRLRNVVDVDTSFKDIRDDVIHFESSQSAVGGVTIPAVEIQTKDLTSEISALHSSGNRLKLKSMNERLKFFSSVASSGVVSMPNAAQFDYGVRVRIMYILSKNEPITNLSQIFDFDGDNSALLTLYPTYKPNPGITYRVVYDKVRTIRQNTNREMLIRLPQAVFYDRGSFQFSVNTPGQLMNNYLTRVIMVDSVSFANSLDVFVYSTRRYKYFDTGPSTQSITALTEKVNALDTRVGVNEQTVQQIIPTFLRKTLTDVLSDHDFDNWSGTSLPEPQVWQIDTYPTLFSTYNEWYINRRITASGQNVYHDPTIGFMLRHLLAWPSVVHWQHKDKPKEYVAKLTPAPPFLAGIDLTDNNDPN